MKLRICLLSFFLIFSITLLAQDKIYTKAGEVISAKVTSINVNTITYKRFDNQQGPDYTISKKDVLKIIYENGTTDNFEGQETIETTQRSVKSNRGTDKNLKKDGNSNKQSVTDRIKAAADKNLKKYGSNIFTIVPGAYTADMDGSLGDVGIGLCYERLLDARGHISVTLPVLVNFSSNRSGNGFLNGYPGSVASVSGYTALSLMPGVKFYPARKDRSVRYAIGASFFAFFGSEPSFVYDPNTGGGGNIHYALYGLMLTNSINISVTKHLFLGLDFNSGIPVSDNRFVDRSGVEEIFIAPILQFVLKVGYRY